MKPKPLHRTFYEKYIHSLAWMQKADAAKRAAGFQCEDCGVIERLEAHHKHYRNLGCELLTDLACLCHDCHTERHCGAQCPGCGTQNGEEDVECWQCGWILGRTFEDYD